MIKDHNQAMDLMQDTFLRAFDSCSTFEGVNAKGWIFRIARNLTIDSIRKNKPISYFFDTAQPIFAKGVSPEHSVTLSETQRELYTALGKIKVSYRDVIILRKIEGFSITEAATILDWNESKVRTTLSRGMKALRKQLEKEGYKHEAIR